MAEQATPTKTNINARDRDRERYEARYAETIRVKRAKNGFLVQDLDGEHVYLELGSCVERGEGDDPATVAEHIARFFNGLAEGQ